LPRKPKESEFEDVFEPIEDEATDFLEDSDDELED
jgi:hypothetical protein